MGLGSALKPLPFWALGWLKEKRFGMAVEKPGHATFSAWRSWWASLGESGFRGEFMVVVRRGVYAQGERWDLRDTRRVTVTH